jgi:hypothetical protein
MKFRRVVDHLQGQHWTAIFIDLVIVVVGVFIGMQVSNWNDDRVERARENNLLVELRAEVAESIRQTDIQIRAFAQVERAGEKAMAYLDAGKPCTDDCWPVIVEFFHASQWQTPMVGLPTYEEMRRNGWPRQRAIVDAVEAYLRQSHQLSAVTQQPPAYRALVRGLIPLSIHKHYWADCFKLANGEESYVEDCPQAVAPEVSAAGVAAIASNPDIRHALTEWTGFVPVYSASLAGKNDAAKRVLALIDAELAKTK